MVLWATRSPKPAGACQVPAIVAGRARTVHDLDGADENSPRQILGCAAELSIAGRIALLLRGINIDATALVSWSASIFKALEAAENELGVGLANAERDSARHFH